MRVIDADELDEQDSIKGDTKTGRWIPDGENMYECSHCWGLFDKPSTFCPICGQRNFLEEKTE